MISRRDFIKMATLSGILISLSTMLPRKAGAGVVRPPGAIKEFDFLKKCIRCGKCIEACEKLGTGTLEPCGISDGFFLLGTPKVNPLRAPCEARYGRCEGKLPCVKACITGALVWVEANQIKMGSVRWKPEYCIAVRFRGGCLVCAEVCPVPGAIIPINKIPKFNSSKCIGCGRCVKACPAKPKALKLTPEGERRF